MYLCIDIGGTKTIIALVSSSGQLLHSVKFATMRDQDQFYAELLRQIRAHFTTDKLLAISVAIPGIVKRNRAVWLGNLPWQDFDLAQLLGNEFNAPVFLENDANLAALAEAHLCKGRSLYLTFSTGIGGAVVEDGAILKKFQHLEPGHEIYAYGNRSAEWEDLASAGAIRSHYNLNVEEITDPIIWDDIVERMLLGLIPLIKKIHPDRLYLGGPLGLAIEHYRKTLRQKLRQSLPARLKVPRIFRAKYGHLSVIYGCYYHAKLKLN